MLQLECNKESTNNTTEGDKMSYNEKFKLELTSKELEIIEYAIEYYNTACLTPDSDKKIGNKIIKKLYSEAYN